MECVCPLPAALVSIPNQVCPENLGQIQKFLFQRMGTPFGTSSFITLAAWTPLLSAIDETKVVVTPFLDNVIIPPAEPITEGGGDNTTLNGREIVIGAGAVVASANLRSVQASIVKAIKLLGCELDLGVYMINEFNSLIGVSVDAGVTVTPIPVHALFVSDAGNEGKNTHDKAPIRFGMDYGWRDDLYIAPLSALDFNPKTALVTP